MPGMDGCGVCKKIKTDENTKNTVVIMMTGFADEDFEKKSLKVGADEFLRKPIKLKKIHDLLDKIHKTD